MLATNLNEFGVKGDLATGTLEITRLVGDANDDNKVDFDDLLALAKHYGQSSLTYSYSEGDFNGDHAVDFNDLLLLAQHYNQTVADSATTDVPADLAADWTLAQSLVPEPATLGLVAAALAATVRRRRSRPA